MPIIVKHETGGVRPLGWAVIDGDGLRCVVDVRLWGCDAPEYSQPLANAAQLHLERRLKAAALVSLVPMAQDVYGRIVAKVICRRGKTGMDLSSDLVRNGLAVSLEDEYAEDEAFARERRRGVWKLKDFVRPDEFRRALARRSITVPLRVKRGS